MRDERFLIREVTNPSRTPSVTTGQGIERTIIRSVPDEWEM